MFTVVNGKQVFVTYRRSDGKPCFGEYAFMTDFSGLDEEESDIIEEHWTLASVRTIPHPDPARWLEYDADHLYEEDEEDPVRKFKEH